MPDNTNVNANSAVVVVGRTAPVPPGQQKSEKSIPVVIANDQSTIPVAEQNKIQSEVALSLLGIPRSEVALGIFADVNTYDVNPTEWSSTPENYATVQADDGLGSGGTLNYGWGLTHVPEESGALVESPIDETAILTSKRFFRYQPGRVSAATFGVKTSGFSTSVTGVGIHNPAIRKYGIFDKFDGYYWETRNSGAGDNFCCVRRTQSLIYDNPLPFEDTTTGQTDDYGCTNPIDQLAARASETEVGTGASDTSGAGYKEKKFGDLILLRDKLLMTHAGMYDPTLLQPETKNGIGKVETGNANNSKITLTGLGKLISNVGYSTVTGLMDITTTESHGFYKGKYLTLSGIGMTCYLSYTYGVSGTITGGTGYGNNLSNVEVTTTGGTGTGLKVKITTNGSGVVTAIRFGASNATTIQSSLDIKDYSNGDTITLVKSGGNGGSFTLSKTESSVKVYPGGSNTNNLGNAADNDGYTVVKVSDANNFTVNVGVSTVATFYKQNGIAIGLREGQFVRYSKGINAAVLSNLEDKGIYAVRDIETDSTFSTGICTVRLREVNKTTGVSLSGSDADSDNTHFLVTPVPFVQPNSDINGQIPGLNNVYNQIKTNDKAAESAGTGMFPYKYSNSNNTADEGYIDTTETTTVTLKDQIDALNGFYDKWVNQNVDIDFLNVYEYRVPRSRFSGDRLDSKTDLLKYSDVVDTRLAGQTVPDPSTGTATQDTSIWNLDFGKVTMYKIEFSWYGAVGALFLAYVPVSNGEARWVRVHHLRASNQLKVSSLGNATLPITYMSYGGGGPDRSFGYAHNLRTVNFQDALGNQSYSENIVKYGASYYIDGGDRGTVKLFSHATPDNIDIFGSKRVFTNLNFAQAGSSNASEPYLSGPTSTSLGGSFYVGAKVITGNPLDQNIEVIYTSIESTTHRIYLNKSLSATSGSVTIIPNRPTPVIGLKCRDFIQSSTGRSVRNRTQVYPTRLSTGSVGPKVVQMDFLKTPLFQTTSIVTSDSIGDGNSIKLASNPDTADGSYDLGKRGKPLAVKIPLGKYIGTHKFIPGSSSLTDAIKVVTNGAGGSASAGDTPDISSTITAGEGIGAVYDSSTGIITFTTAAHGLGVGAEIRIKKGSLTYTCSLDNHATNHSYPRETDPIFDNILDGDQSNAGYGTIDTSDGYSLKVSVLTVPSPTTFTVRITNATTNTPSAAEYIRDIGTGVYGYFRGQFKTENPARYVSVLGFLENRGQDRTKGNIQNDEYYFSALESTEDDIILPNLSNDNKFLYESNSSPKDGSITTSAQSDFTLAPLSSIKISPQLRAPIPNTGTVVSSIFVPPTGEAYDLSSYFDYNKEYLSFPLTNTIESLFLVASSKETYDASTASASMSASITWEEQ